MVYLRYTYWALLLLITSQISSQSSFPANAFVREGLSLDGSWQYIVDPYENGFYNYRYEAFDQQTHPGKAAFFKNAKIDHPAELLEYNFDKSDSLLVPGDWNTQRERLYYYEGSIWYKKSFDYDRKDASNRLFIHFGAVNYHADVYCNGQKVGSHEGGFTPFAVEVTHLIKATDNFVVVKVDNKRHRDAVPTLNTDWWNYGGITRSVKVLEVDPTFVSAYTIALDPTDSTHISAQIEVSGPSASGATVAVAIPELSIAVEAYTDEAGRVTLDMYSDDLRYWSPMDPYLYPVQIVAADDTLTDLVGLRSIATRGSDILLNGRSIFLKGISIHEESPLRGGRAHTRADAEILLTWAKELGCNYVRLAHYPHNEHMVRLADEMGLLVWAENPVYWTINWENPKTYSVAQQQLTELIGRDINRASVVIWSMANETPRGAARDTFLTRLAAHARSLDPSRLLSAALEQRDMEGSTTVRTIDDPFAEVVDVLSFNQYVGWYDGLPDKCQRISWHIKQAKPVIISEFGAGAKYGLHGDKGSRWTEEYQEDLYRETLQMIDGIDQLRGVSPWILVDFRSPRRVLPEIQDGYNRKGLLSEDGQRKKAFYTLQRYYQSR